MATKFRIPEQYDIPDGLMNILVAAIPDTRIEISGRFVYIDADITPAQKTALKAAIVPLLTTAPDVTTI